MKSCKYLSAASLFFATLAFLFSSHSGANAQNIQICEEGPIHEAFIAPESGSIILDAVALEPPRPITERIPTMTDPEAGWIPGYWAWQPHLQDFVWVSGVWRRPPPGHQWIPGYWESFDEGWVWIRGFWSPVALSQLPFIDVAPPDLIDEDVAQAPGSSYFWMPGYWEFPPSDRQYLWVSGQWGLFDPHWVFVPAHYLWRPDGYIFIPAYWDWPMETRGTVYSCVFIQPAARAQIVYLPVVIIEYPIIIDHLFPYYPDYICFFGHFHHHHPGFWDDFCCVPPWWGWEAWWSFSWHDHWALWWWWSHPGFPQPLWLSAQFSNMLPPPGADLLAMMANVKGPGIITPKGVVKPGDLREGLADVVGGKPDLLPPILPSKPQELNEVIDAVIPTIPDRILKPTGRRTPDLRRQVLKPTIRPTLPEGAVRIRPIVPSKPRIPTTRPPIRRPIRPPATYPPPRETVPPSYVPQRPPRRPYWPPGRRQRPPKSS
ncbi:MAG: hypothetical protein K940chlam7_00956 [Chlamydiae bacterium]|nr:hypothetical protein [Chlamydiota bacterium]